jgi:hypothetical protein
MSAVLELAPSLAGAVKMAIQAGLGPQTLINLIDTSKTAHFGNIT